MIGISDGYRGANSVLFTVAWQKGQNLIICSTIRSMFGKNPFEIFFYLFIPNSQAAAAGLTLVPQVRRSITILVFTHWKFDLSQLLVESKCFYLSCLFALT
ncbi:hypothetical protein BpHYR1_010447 [Brachionus plicatilis]|uniref:Uncharacterized protein n=1 Tax=Brachionus plicatilis TaxID=10195 RepID=A0A3M7SD74_BRAPC|nr:hypothetical protein BpHYR1_010447 [Brachionus plicatilis]